MRGGGAHTMSSHVGRNKRGWDQVGLQPSRVLSLPQNSFLLGWKLPNLPTYLLLLKSMRRKS